MLRTIKCQCSSKYFFQNLVAHCWYIIASFLIVFDEHIVAFTLLHIEGRELRGVNSKRFVKT